MKLQLAPSLLVLLFAGFLTSQLTADDWPQWRGPQRDGVWRETGIVEKLPAGTLKPVWRAPVGPGYSGPTVAAGRVYVTSRQTEPKQTETVHCFDFKTGDVVWTHTYDCQYSNIGYTDGPRASVGIDNGKAYALGAMGDLHCLDAATGKVLWHKNLDQVYSIRASRRMPVWGIAASPLIYKDLIILHIGGKDACVVALDKNSGEEKWKALRDRASYSAPILIQQGGKDVVVVWNGDSLAGLNPTTGATYWRYPFGPRNMPIGIATPIVHANKLFVTSFYDGALMMKLDESEPDARKVWQRNGRSERNTDALQSIISTPLFLGEYIYGVDSYGELRCLEAATGDRLWESNKATPRDRWSNIHFVRQGDSNRVWLFNERGELIISELSPQGYKEISRAKLIEPTTGQNRRRGGTGVTWSHPAYANRHVVIRNDKEILAVDLSK